MVTVRGEGKKWMMRSGYAQLSQTMKLTRIARPLAVTQRIRRTMFPSHNAFRVHYRPRKLSGHKKGTRGSADVKRSISQSRSLEQYVP